MWHTGKAEAVIFMDYQFLTPALSTPRPPANRGQPVETNELRGS